MTDEPRTAYYQTGAVRRLLAPHKEPAAKSALTDSTRVLTAHDASITAVMPARRPRISRPQLALSALVLALLTVAFIAGRKTAQPRAASSQVHQTVGNAPPAKTAPAQSARASSEREGAPRSAPAPAPEQVQAMDEGTLGAAVDALAIGDYPAALRRYQALADARPHDEVFASIASTVARKLQERCTARPNAGDPACAEP